MNPIARLLQLDLKMYPIREIEELLLQTREIGIILHHFHPGKLIDRVVNNTIHEPEFNSVARISFRPAHLNQTFLRASTPRNTMFYGTVISDEIRNEVRFARLAGMSEVSSLMRNADVVEGFSIVTTGRWEVLKDLNLATVIDPGLEYNQPYLQYLRQMYVDRLATVDTVIRETTYQWLEYLSRQFSKRVPNGNNHEYLISSLWTEIFVRTQNMDGVIYPSVQSDGYGLCVAIHPKAMKKIKLVTVEQSRITKSIGNGQPDFHILPQKFCYVPDGATSFQLQDIKP